jgi:hypothetical protein
MWIFIKEVEFYSGLLPSNKRQCHQLCFEFKQKDGRTDSYWALSATLGSSDIGLTLEGPIGKKINLYIFLYRRSYLQFFVQGTCASVSFPPIMITSSNIKYKFRPEK